MKTTTKLCTTALVALAALQVSCYVDTCDDDYAGWDTVSYTCQAGFSYSGGRCVPDCPSGVYDYGCVDACDLAGCGPDAYCVRDDYWDSDWRVWVEFGTCQEYCSGGCWSGSWCDHETRSCWDACDYDPCYSWEICVPDDYDSDVAHCFSRRREESRLPAGHTWAMDAKTLQLRTPLEADGLDQLTGFGENSLASTWTVRIAAIDGERMLLEAGPRGQDADWLFEAERDAQTGRFTAWATPESLPPALADVEIAGYADGENLIIETLRGNLNREGQIGDEFEFTAGADTETSPRLNERVVTIAPPA